MTIYRDPEPDPDKGAAPPPAPEAKPTDVDSAMDKLMGADEARQTERQDKIKKVVGEGTPPEPAKAAEPEKKQDEPPKETQPSPAPKAEEKSTPDLAEYIKRQTEVLEKLAAPKEEKPTEPTAKEEEFVPFKASQQDIDDVIEGGEKAIAVIDKVYQKSLTDATLLTAKLLEKYHENTVLPLAKFYQAQQVQAAEGRFFAQYKDLEPVADLAREVADKLVAAVRDGKIPKYKDEKDFFEAVSGMTKKFIAGLNVKPADVKPQEVKPTPPPTGGNGGRQPEGTRASKSEDGKLMTELLDDAGVTRK